MPTDILYFPAAGPAFTAESQLGNYTHSYPLGAREPTHLLVEADFCRITANYSRPAADTLLAYTINGSTTNCYFIDDAAFRPFGGKPGPLSEWRRSWASVPASWYDGESYPYTYPAVSAAAVGNTYSVTAITASGTNYVLAASTTGINAADSIYCSLKFTRGGYSFQGGFFTTAVAVTATNVTIGNSLLGSGSFTNVSGSVAKASAARTNVSTKVVASLLLHDYALSSATNVSTDLPLFAPFSAVDATGSETLSLTNTTTPTAATYAALVTGGQRLVVECWQRRYLGNIWERITRTVPAL